MSKQGIDVSWWQGDSVNWKSVKRAGKTFAIIRAGHEVYEDSTYEGNAKRAHEAGIPIGMYFFSYADTVDKAIKEADLFCDIVERVGVKPALPLYYDYEYDSEKKYPAKDSIVDMGRAFLKRIKERGYEAGLYTNLDFLSRGFYQLLKEGWPLWLAQYGPSTPALECDVWQFTSTGRVSGVPGNVDCDIAYKDYTQPDSGKDEEDKPVEDQLSKILTRFAYYIGHGGYHEKANGNNRYLGNSVDDFLANAGSANYTYMGKLCGVNPGQWCAMMVSTAVYEALGYSTAAARKAMWGVWPYTACNQLWEAADDDHRFWSDYQRWTLGKGDRKSYKPCIGDVIIFSDNGAMRTHTGMVYAVDNTTVYTYEGNSGNMARKRAYGLSDSYIYGYVKLNVTGSGGGGGEEPKPEPQDDKMLNIKAFQTWLDVEADGEPGPKTKKAAIKSHQRYLNSKYGYALTVDGEWGPLTYYATQPLRRNDESNDVLIWQGLLYCNGYDPVGLDGTYGANTVKATQEAQKKLGLNPTGVADRYTWAKILGYSRPAHKVLKLGSYGLEVKYLQERLTIAGFPTATTADFDKATEESVKAFQKSKGLEDDGIAGPKTWGELD